MENALGLIGTIIGALGFFLAVFIAVMQAKAEKRNAQEKAEEKERHAQELAEEKEMHAKERAEEKELHAKERAEEKEMHAKERAEEKEMHAKERAEEKELHAKELEWLKQELETQKQEKARSDRLMFLADRIFDPTIPRELRLPFYEEYIKMNGNGTAVKFWLIEGEREKKALQPT